MGLFEDLGLVKSDGNRYVIFTSIAKSIEPIHFSLLLSQGHLDSCAASLHSGEL